MKKNYITTTFLKIKHTLLCMPILSSLDLLNKENPEKHNLPFDYHRFYLKFYSDKTELMSSDFDNILIG